MSTNMGFMTREVRSHERSVCSIFLKADLSATNAGFDDTGLLSGSQHVDVAEDSAGVLSVRLKNPGQRFLGVSCIGDSAVTPVYSIVTDGQEIDISGLSTAEVMVRLDVSYVSDET